MIETDIIKEEVSTDSENENVFEILNEEVSPSQFPEIKPEELEKTISSIKVEVTEEDKKKYSAVVPPPPDKKKPGRQPKNGTVKKDTPTPVEFSELTDEEVIDGMDQKTKDLYMEFNSFLQDKTEITADTGIKDTIPTGIDLLDTIMGGGFAIGSMGVITGNPGSGKCLHYDEILEIYE